MPGCDGEPCGCVGEQSNRSRVLPSLSSKLVTHPEHPRGSRPDCRRDISASLARPAATASAHLDWTTQTKNLNFLIVDGAAWAAGLRRPTTQGWGHQRTPGFRSFGQDCEDTQMPNGRRVGFRLAGWQFGREPSGRHCVRRNRSQTTCHLQASFERVCRVGIKSS